MQANDQSISQKPRRNIKVEIMNETMISFSNNGAFGTAA